MGQGLRVQRRPRQTGPVLGDVPFSVSGPAPCLIPWYGLLSRLLMESDCMEPYSKTGFPLCCPEMAQGFLTSPLLTFWARSFFVVRGWPVCGRTFSSTLGLCSPETSSPSLPRSDFQKCLWTLPNTPHLGAGGRITVEKYWWRLSLGLPKAVDLTSRPHPPSQAPEG